MARASKRLSARTVATIGKPGRHADGDGLYLIVDPSGAKRWLFMFRRDGKLKEMGLGGLSSVSLAEARERAGEARRVLATGRNPIEERKAAKASDDAVTTFGPFADALVDSIASGFRNEKHLAQWRMTLTTYAAPLRSKRLDAITTEDVLGVLFRDWAGERTSFPREIAETALAHTVGDETERAYRRGDALEKRRKLMEAWAAFVTKPAAKSQENVVSIGARSA